MKKSTKTTSILALDIGNTSITFAGIRGKKVEVLRNVKTIAKERDIVKILNLCLKKIASPIEAVIICSVVPKMEKIVGDIIKRKTTVKVYIIGKDIKVPLKSKYNPKQIGQDRLVCAYAAGVLYGAPALVVDLGTATTLDIVSKRNEYLGGIIIPGIEMSAESLFRNTALLPKITITRPQALIGKDTQNSILSGIFYGYGEMIHGLIGLIARKSHIKPKVIVTGGYLRLMKSYIAGKVTAFDRDLVFKGLGVLWEDRVKRQRLKDMQKGHI